MEKVSRIIPKIELVELDNEPRPEPLSYPGGPAWRENSNCLGVDEKVFFPEPGQSMKTAKAICDRCVVVKECLEYALESEKFGVWGGESERGRRRIKRERRKQAKQMDMNSEAQ